MAATRLTANARCRPNKRRRRRQHPLPLSKLRRQQRRPLNSSKTLGAARAGNKAGPRKLPLRREPFSRAKPSAMVLAAARNQAPCSKEMYSRTQAAALVDSKAGLRKLVPRKAAFR
jgi:hypothetical protein